MQSVLTALVCAMLSFSAVAADNGLITRPSKYSAAETLDRLEAALKANGFIIFARLDHAKAAESVGLTLKPTVVVVYGNPKAGTALMVQSPTLGIDLPPKALVWEDAKGQVWLSYNSAEYLYQDVYHRHGIVGDPARMKAYAAVLEKVAAASAE